MVLPKNLIFRILSTLHHLSLISKGIKQDTGGNSLGNSTTKHIVREILTTRHRTNSPSHHGKSSKQSKSNQRVTTKFFQSVLVFTDLFLVFVLAHLLRWCRSRKSEVLFFSVLLLLLTTAGQSGFWKKKLCAFLTPSDSSGFLEVFRHQKQALPLCCYYFLGDLIKEIDFN